MLSKARVMGHPLHPMLIPFPIAFTVGALGADIVSKVSGSAAWYFIGYVLTIAAFCGALLAAIPGLIDYFARVPSGAAKRTATYHLILNLCIVGLYVASWLIKNQTGAPPSWAAMICEIAGVSLLLASGWLGWQLVYQHHIGVVETERREEKVRRIS